MTTAPAIIRPEDVDASLVIQRRDQSRRWMRKNVYDEWTEVFQAAKCRTSPIYKLDANGKATKEVDKTKTNVAMPDLNLIYRRNSARMTAQPYRLKYIGGDEAKAEMLSALAAQQYDRSNEARHDVRVVMSSELLGWGVSKVYWDTIHASWKFRRAIVWNNQVVYRDRASIMRQAGAPDDEIEGAVSQLGPEMSDEEIAQILPKSANEIAYQEKVKKYEGPVVKWCFSGDIFAEPDALLLDESGYVIEQFRETDKWLEERKKDTYKDENGQEVPVFDPKACDEVLASSGDYDPQDDDLRQMFNQTIGRTTEEEQMPARLRPRKRFRFLREDAEGEDGRIWITYVCETPRVVVGRRPYDWDLQGKTCYTELVPLPDLISYIGDSTPRLLRFLYQMHNLTVAQNFDYISGLLRKFILKKTGINISQDVVERGAYRELALDDLNGVKVLEEPQLPAGAFEREIQVMRMMATAEPTMNTVDTGSPTNPMAGKLATTAMLNAKAGDALTQFKLAGRDQYLRELGSKKLWMNQQAAQEAWEIQSNFWGPALREQLAQMTPQQLQELAGNYDPTQGPEEWAMSARYGKTAAIKIHPLAIQEPYEVEPEAGSYLAVDDDLRRAAAMDLNQAAANAPDVANRREVFKFSVSTIRGIGDVNKYLVPEPSGPPPIQPRVGINVSFKGEELPAEVQNSILQEMGLPPSEGLVGQDVLKRTVQTAEAANAAHDMLSEAHEPPPPEAGNGNGSSPAKPSKPKPGKA